MTPAKSKIFTAFFRACENGGQDTPVAWFKAALELLTEEQLKVLVEKLRTNGYDL